MDRALRFGRRGWGFDSLRAYKQYMNFIKKTLRYFLNHKKISIIVLVITIILGYFLIPKAPKQIQTTKIERGKIIQSVTATGTVDSVTTANLSFLTAGRLTYVGVKSGDEVKSGQTIAVLDQRTLRTNLQQALREYAKQRNSFDTTKEANLNRTPQDALSTAMKRILENNQSDLEKAVNSVELQQFALEQSVLTSPIDGIIIRADAEVAGMNVGSTTTYTVADINNLEFTIDVDEADIGKISIGQIVNVTLDAFPDNTITLSVTKIDFASHKSDTGGTVYAVKAMLPDNLDQRYKIGMNGDAEIIIAQKPKAMLIPLSALIDEKNIYVKTGKSFSKRTVKLGLESDTQAEVLSGVNTGDEVALQPEEVDKIISKK